MAFKVDPKLAEDYEKFLELSQREDIQRLHEERLDYIVNIEMEMTARWEEGIKEGKIEGIQQGIEIGIEIGTEIGIEKVIEKGKAIERRNFADKLFDFGMDDEFIVKTTELDLETVVRLRSEVSQH